MPEDLEWLNQNRYRRYPFADSATMRGAVDYDTAQAGGASTITLAAAASAVNDAYNDLEIWLTGGTGAGQIRTITDYVGSTRTATVDAAWTTEPDATTTYRVMASTPLALDLVVDCRLMTAAEVDRVWLRQVIIGETRSLMLAVLRQGEEEADEIVIVPPSGSGYYTVVTAPADLADGSWYRFYLTLYLPALAAIAGPATYTFEYADTPLLPRTVADVGVNSVASINGLAGAVVFLNGSSLVAQAVPASNSLRLIAAPGSGTGRHCPPDTTATDCANAITTVVGKTPSRRGAVLIAGGPGITVTESAGRVIIANNVNPARPRCVDEAEA